MEGTFGWSAIALMQEMKGCKNKTIEGQEIIYNSSDDYGVDHVNENIVNRDDEKSAHEW